MKSSLKFSVAAAVALTSVVPNLALAADKYDISVLSGLPVYQLNGTSPRSINGDFDSGELTNNDENEVNVNLTGNQVFIGTIYGGYVTTGSGSYNDDVTKNIVTMNGGVATRVIGGKADLKAAIDNKVYIKNGNVMSVMGGQSIQGGVKNNSVNITGGHVQDVCGGYSNGKGEVSGNSVVISGGIIGGNVYAAKTSGTAKDNTVTLTGGVIKGFIDANQATANSMSNNVLNIGESSTNALNNFNTLEAFSITGFNKINFYLSDTMSNKDIALKLTDVSGYVTDLNSMTINVDNLSTLLSNLSNSTDKYYLFKNDNGGKISVNDTWLKSNQQVIGNIFEVISKTQYKVDKSGIFQSEDLTDLFITGKLNSTETITGDTFGDDEAGIKDGIFVNLTNGADYGDLKLNLSKQTTINLANAKNVGEINAASSDVSIANSTLNGSTSVKSLNLLGTISAANDILAVNDIGINGADLALQGGLRSSNSNIAFNDSKGSIKGDIEANKVSFVSGSNLNTITANDIKAKEIEFNLPNSVKYNDVALKLTTTGNTDLSSTKVSAFLSDASSLKGNGAIHLIQTAGKLTAPSGADVSGVAVNVAGLINVAANIELDSTGKNLDLSFNGTPSGSGGGSSSGGGATANANSKQLLENSLAGMIAVNESINNLVSNLDNLSSNTNSNSSTNANSQSNNANSDSNSQSSINENSGEAVVFANIIGHDKRFITGSHVDSKGFSLSSGIVGNDYYNSGKLTTGLFLEYGKAKYESVLDNGLVGEGKTEFIGGGAFGKFKFINNFYTEASARIGNIKTKAEKGMYDEYKLSNTYYGAHFGLGKVFDLTSSNELDIYAKYFYSHIAGEEIELRGVNVDLGSVTSSKFKAGFKDTMKFSDTSSLYAGLAYQYEAKGDAKGSLSAFNQSANIASPSLKGSTGIGEIGYVYETNSIKFDIGAKGYVGKERGYSGNLGVTFKF